MSKLSDSARTFKMFVKVLAVSAVGYYIAILLVIPTVKRISRSIVKNQDPPTASFGKLPPLKFVEKPINTTKPKYSLNTTTGKLPKGFPDRMNVYKTVAPQASFMEGSTAIENAGYLGFGNYDLSSDLKGDFYTWRKLSTASTLEIDLRTKVLRLNTDITRNTNAYPPGFIDEYSAISQAKTLFQSLGRFKDGLYPNGTSTVSYGSVKGNLITKPITNRDRQLAMVDFFRQIGDYPVLGPDPKKGLLHAIIRNPTGTPTPLNSPIVEAYFWEIELASDATYSILSIEDAWNIVKQHKGVITHVREKDYNPFEKWSPKTVDTILVDNVYLAYYDTYERQDLIQPIYVFEGKYQSRSTPGGDVTIYYPAILAEHIKGSQ
jgi:hypothetical protein